MPILTPTVIVNGNALAIDGTVPIAWIDLTLTNFGNIMPIVLGTGQIFKTSVRITPNQTTGAWTVTFFKNNVIDPGHAASPVQTYYKFDFFDQQGNIVATGTFQFLADGTFDNTALTPYTP